MTPCAFLVPHSPTRRSLKRARHIGAYVVEEDAARAYDHAAIEMLGADAGLNFRDSKWGRGAQSAVGRWEGGRRREAHAQARATHLHTRPRTRAGMTVYLASTGGMLETAPKAAPKAASKGSSQYRWEHLLIWAV